MSIMGDPSASSKNKKMFIKCINDQKKSAIVTLNSQDGAMNETWSVMILHPPLLIIINTVWSRGRSASPNPQIHSLKKKSIDGW